MEELKYKTVIEQMKNIVVGKEELFSLGGTLVVVKRAQEEDIKRWVTNAKKKQKESSF